MSHHITQTFDVVGFKKATQAIEFAFKKGHLMQKRIFVEEEKLAPHFIVHAGDSCEVAEGVTRVVLQMLRLLTGHERHCDTMRELRNERDDLVMLCGCKLGYVGESKHFTEVTAKLDGIGRIFSEGVTT